MRSHIYWNTNAIIYMCVCSHHHRLTGTCTSPLGAVDKHRTSRIEEACSRHLQYDRRSGNMWQYIVPQRNAASETLALGTLRQGVAGPAVGSPNTVVTHRYTLVHRSRVQQEVRLERLSACVGSVLTTERPTVRVTKIGEGAATSQKTLCVFVSRETCGRSFDNIRDTKYKAKGAATAKTFPELLELDRKKLGEWA